MVGSASLRGFGTDAMRRPDAAEPCVTRRPATRFRVLPGPQTERFAKARSTRCSRLRIGSPPTRIAWDSGSTDRALAHAHGADVISDATPLGVLQVPASGQPILLMADRQTTGGYAKLATVITADIGLAGQLGPGDAITFAVCSPREAMAALIAQERSLMAAEAR